MRVSGGTTRWSYCHVWASLDWSIVWVDKGHSPQPTMGSVLSLSVRVHWEQNKTKEQKTNKPPPAILYIETNLVPIRSLRTKQKSKRKKQTPGVLYPISSNPKVFLGAESENYIKKPILKKILHWLIQSGREGQGLFMNFLVSQLFNKYVFIPWHLTDITGDRQREILSLVKEAHSHDRIVQFLFPFPINVTEIIFRCLVQTGVHIARILSTCEFIRSYFPALHKHEIYTLTWFWHFDSGMQS